MSTVTPEQGTEHLKQYVDYMKHLTTLSTGSILILTTFLDKVFLKPQWESLVVVSLVGFMLSIVASVVGHALLIDAFVGRGTSDKSSMTRGGAVAMMCLGFLTGVLSLIIFTVKNLMA